MIGQLFAAVAQLAVAQGALAETDYLLGPTSTRPMPAVAKGPVSPRVLFLYDSQFAAEHPDPTVRQDQFINYANDAFISSDMPISLERAGSVLVEGASFQDMLDLLFQMRNRVGPFSNLDELRVQAESDLVVFVSGRDQPSTDPVCGRGFVTAQNPDISSAIAAMYDQSDCDELPLFAHEVGHVFGSGHEIGDCDDASISFACALSAANVRTIMVGSLSGVSQQYSNPRQSCGAGLCGVDGAADNATAMPIIAGNLSGASQPNLIFGNPSYAATSFGELTFAIDRSGWYGTDVSISIETSEGAPLVIENRTFNRPFSIFGGDSVAIFVDVMPGNYVLVVNPTSKAGLRTSADLQVNPSMPPTATIVFENTDGTAEFDIQYTSDTEFETILTLEPGGIERRDAFPAAVDGLALAAATPLCNQATDYELRVANAGGGAILQQGTISIVPCNEPSAIFWLPATNGYQVLVQTLGNPVVTFTATVTGPGLSDSFVVEVPHTGIVEQIVDIIVPAGRLVDGVSYSLSLDLEFEGMTIPQTQDNFVANVPETIFEEGFEGP